MGLAVAFMGEGAVFAWRERRTVVRRRGNAWGKVLREETKWCTPAVRVHVACLVLVRRQRVNCRATLRMLRAIVPGVAGAKIDRVGLRRKTIMFTLDSRLQQDCLLIGDFPLCRLLLMNDASYPWFILVPRREEVSEIFQLDGTDQRQLWQETSLLAETLKDTFAADKINVATLGNVVSQLHMHVIVRRRDDAAWPAPVWGRQPASPYDDAQIRRIIDKLRLVLTEDFKFAGDLA